MSEPDWRAALFARRTYGVRLGTSAIAAVLDELVPGLRERPPFTVTQIVGTNGKGSTAAMLDHALRGLGPSVRGGPSCVGLYTSPHLIRVGERIRIGGRAIADEDVRLGVEQVGVAEARAGVALSFFEVLTAIAVHRFALAGCTHVILEAGLGGRLDATTAIAPDQVLIARIGVDHERFLGDSIAAIAGEKAAVIRAGVPVSSVRQPDEARAVIEAVVRERGAPLEFVEPLARAPEGLPGEHQRHNAALALAGLAHLAPAEAWTPAQLDGVRWPGRLERVGVGVGATEGGSLWFDVAHNLDGVAAVLASADAIGLRPDVIVFGTLADKPGAAMAERLRSLAPLWLVPPADEGSFPLALLAGGVEREFAGRSDPALIAALRARLEAGQQVLVCGSHHLVGALMARFAAVEAPDPSDPMPRR